MKKVFIASLLLFMMLAGYLTPGIKAEASYSPDKVVTEGKKYIGTKYRYGGTTPRGFDCSGFVGYTYKKSTGKVLPRTAAEIFSKGSAVKKSSLKKGDLVFFSTYKRGASHVGIYVGSNQFIHAASSGVKIDSMNNVYWKPKFLGAKRL
ncbi:cell wall-associated NlpC family hydrolase [Peribacillus deserti]|uniref:Cell wall-associated NlpC family hydrolase n=1 Tax=Peribacillus deserti TaxID=673318 RepID=A0ABS2QKF9_9BACI|nr:cell wall-associated NlpC family hydrolase [Peribacillus deserti]